MKEKRAAGYVFRKKVKFSEMTHILKKNYAKLAAILVLFLISAQLSFIQDDAYISFRYVDNFLSGYGLVWEPGHYIQGYTNFLWVMLLSAASFFYFPLDITAITLGIIHFIPACFLFFLICNRFFDTRVAIGASIVLATNFSFASYATGGLETMQQTFLMLCALFMYQNLIKKPGSLRTALAFSVVCGLLMLCRLDSAIFIFCIGLGALWTVRQSGLKMLAAIFVPGALILGLFLTFCYFYYGNILPNTFYVKAEGGTLARMGVGLNYLAGFTLFYAIAIPLLLGLVFAFRNTARLFFIPLAAYSILWSIYIIWVGGDFMEFRMLVPALPIFLLLIANAFNAFAFEHKELVGSVCVSFFVLISSYYSFGGFRLGGVERIQDLEGHLFDRHQDWIGIGQRLAETFPGSYHSGPKIAVTAAGAIPFYSKLRAVDMLGLNDSEIARTEKLSSNWPGHQKVADPALLVERRVNLVLGHPKMVRDSEISGIQDERICAKHFYLFGSDVPEEFYQRPVLAMRVNSEYFVVMLYLVDHPSVDLAIENNSIIRLRTHAEDCAKGQDQDPSMTTAVRATAEKKINAT